MGATTGSSPHGIYHWYFRVPDRGSIYFETFCTGIQAICVFAGIIIFTPHSQDSKTTRIIQENLKMLKILKIFEPIPKNDHDFIDSFYK